MLYIIIYFLHILFLTVKGLILVVWNFHQLRCNILCIHFFFHFKYCGQKETMIQRKWWAYSIRSLVINSKLWAENPYSWLFRDSHWKYKTRQVPWWELKQIAKVIFSYPTVASTPKMKNKSPVLSLCRSRASFNLMFKIESFWNGESGMCSFLGTAFY